MKPALTALFCWLIISTGLRAQVIEKLAPTGNFMLVEERVKTVSSTEYRSTLVVITPADTLPPVPVRLGPKLRLTVIPAKPDWPDSEPIIDAEPGPYFIFWGLPQQGGKPAPGRPWPGPNLRLNRDR